MKGSLLSFFTHHSAFFFSVADVVEALVERDELAVGVVELALLDGALDRVESLERGGEFVNARASALPRLDGAGRGVSRARERGECRRALPLPQIDSDLGDAVARVLHVAVNGRQRRVADERG